MQFKFIKRLFFIGPRPKDLRCMLSLTPNAHKALAKLAEDAGGSIQEVVYDILEDALNFALSQGAIATPDTTEEDSANSGRAG